MFSNNFLFTKSLFFKQCQKQQSQNIIIWKISIVFKQFRRVEIMRNIHKHRNNEYIEFWICDFCKMCKFFFINAFYFLSIKLLKMSKLYRIMNNIEIFLQKLFSLIILIFSWRCFSNSWINQFIKIMIKIIDKWINQWQIFSI